MPEAVLISYFKNVYYLHFLNEYSENPAYTLVFLVIFLYKTYIERKRERSVHIQQSGGVWRV